MTPSWAGRVRALCWVLIAAAYYLLAEQVAGQAARGFTPGDYYDLVSRSMLLFLLLLGFAGMGLVGQHQRQPLAAMGLVFRPGWRSEFALGSVLGWAGILATVLPVALFGGLLVHFDLSLHQVLFLVVDGVVLAVASLTEEVLFRGYPFQRLIEATGPFFAVVIMALAFAAVHRQNPGVSTAGMVTTLLAGWLLGLAYLRTRALWVGWGFHFAWNASTCLLFGLPVSGVTLFSPVVTTYTRGPMWLTGAGYGPEGSAVTLVVMLGLLVALARVTRELRHRYALPVIVPGGLAVDIDALARRQHEQGMGPAAAPGEQQLVQILAPGANPAPLVKPAPAREEGP
ncbi:MAG TPA: type II CAAX endopeptidase family protein [Acidobacteriaceae bacterium]